MRLFIAVELPDEVIKHFSFLQSKLKSSEVDQTFSWHQHITLKFLGNLDSADEVVELLKNISFDAFEVSLSKSGVFPSEDIVRVVWVGVEPENPLIELQKKIEDVLHPLNIRNDHPFNPHITLSRVKFVKDKVEFKKILHSLHPEPIKFKVDSFKLIKSDLTPMGPIYTVLASF
jgi:RNA 2',3'-cyclic 3'-phosphodiesterase